MTKCTNKTIGRGGGTGDREPPDKHRNIATYRRKKLAVAKNTCN